MPPPISGAGTAGIAEANASPTTATVRTIADVNNLNIVPSIGGRGDELVVAPQRLLILTDFILIWGSKNTVLTIFTWSDRKSTHAGPSFAGASWHCPLARLS